MRERGQAAMEFLMTYGWAILVVLIAIGALAYFGVLSPGRFLPQSCTLAPGFSCSEFAIYNTPVAPDENLQIFVRNGVGATAGSVTMTAVVINGAETCVEDAVNNAHPTSITEGGSAEFQFDCSGGAGIGAVGERFKATLTMQYTLSGETLQHTITGDITTRIE